MVCANTSESLSESIFVESRCLEDFEWIFPDGCCAWKPLPGSELLHLAERNLDSTRALKDTQSFIYYAHFAEHTRSSSRSSSGMVVLVAVAVPGLFALRVHGCLEVLGLLFKVWYFRFPV